MPDPAAREVIKTMAEQRMAALADRFAHGDMTVGDLQIAMREEIRRAYALQLIAGNNGDQPPSNDWLKLGTVVKSQDAYLEDFMHSLDAGDVSSDAVASRAMLYARSAQSVYWEQAYPDMPAQPCDGSSECLSNCKCSIEEVDGELYWRLGTEDNCPTCTRRAAEWAPYRSEES